MKSTNYKKIDNNNDLKQKFLEDDKFESNIRNLKKDEVIFSLFLTIFYFKLKVFSKIFF